MAVGRIPERNIEILRNGGNDLNRWPGEFRGFVMDTETAEQNLANG